MGPLFVVADEPFGGHAPHFTQGFKHVAVEHLLAIGSIEAFDVAVLHRLTRKTMSPGETSRMNS